MPPSGIKAGTIAGIVLPFGLALLAAICFTIWQIKRQGNRQSPVIELEDLRSQNSSVSTAFILPQPALAPPLEPPSPVGTSPPNPESKKIGAEQKVE